MPSFNDFDLQPATLAVLAKMEITVPTPIQSEAIPVLLAGKDLVGQSATGSGKTLAYSIPLVERLARKKREVQALVLVPTRELAVQVNTVLSQLVANRGLSTALLVGGRPYGIQISALRYGAQIVVGTPGRIKDHLDSGHLVLNQLRICVLDEADQMLDSGFAPAIEEILTTTPETRQMALFSATMPEWIVKLQEKFLKDPVQVDITSSTETQTTIEQIAYQVPHGQKMAALCTLLHNAQGESSLIFGRTKFGVERLGEQLSNLGFKVGTLHGNKSQNARDTILTAFRKGHVQTLLATNVAARGLDIKGIYQVINYELPESSELFTHRIGRTGRMGHQGKAITLLVPSDLPKWRRMAHSLGQVVALQHLVINEEAMNPATRAIPEVSHSPVIERDNDQQPRSRKPASQEYKRRDEASFSPMIERDSEQPRARKDDKHRNKAPLSPMIEQESEQEQPRSRKSASQNPKRRDEASATSKGEQAPVRTRKPFSQSSTLRDEDSITPIPEHPSLRVHKSASQDYKTSAAPMFEQESEQEQPRSRKHSAQGPRHHDEVSISPIIEQESEQPVIHTRKPLLQGYKRRQEAPISSRHEQYSEQRSVRTRTPFSQGPKLRYEDSATPRLEQESEQRSLPKRKPFAQGPKLRYEDSVASTPEQYGEQRPMRSRKPFTQGTKHDSYAASGSTRRRSEGTSSSTSARRSGGFSLSGHQGPKRNTGRKAIRPR